MASLAQMEREVIVERTVAVAGLAGRPSFVRAVANTI
jgi:hypothetical protein